jgi:hypothetical protein
MIVDSCFYVFVVFVFASCNVFGSPSYNFSVSMLFWFYL